MIDKTKTTTDAGDPNHKNKKSCYPQGQIWLVLASLIKKFRGDGFLDQIALDKDKLTIIIRKGEHPDKQFARGFMVQAKNLYKSCRFTDTDLVCQIVSGSMDPYTNFYTQIVLEGNKKGTDAAEVLEELQIMGNEM